jgi:hypothetical protein
MLQAVIVTNSGFNCHVEIGFSSLLLLHVLACQSVSAVGAVFGNRVTCRQLTVATSFQDNRLRHNGRYLENVNQQFKS